MNAHLTANLAFGQQMLSPLATRTGAAKTRKQQDFPFEWLQMALQTVFAEVQRVNAQTTVIVVVQNPRVVVDVTT